LAQETNQITREKAGSDKIIYRSKHLWRVTCYH